MRNWLGYSVGHWEGDTLVIETSNFEPGSSLGSVPNSTEMKMVERLTPMGPNEIRYQATVTDPTVLTAPFAYDFPWRRNDAYEQYEYACHEGNVQIRGYIEGTGTKPWIVAKRQAVVKARDGGGQQDESIKMGLSRQPRDLRRDGCSIRALTHFLAPAGSRSGRQQAAIDFTLALIDSGLFDLGQGARSGARRDHARQPLHAADRWSR